jgi:hypothetical protein
MSLLPFIEWCNDTTLAVAIRESIWMFPALQVVHLVSLAVLGGTILLVDLRMLGLGIRGATASRLAADLAPWTFWSLVIVSVSGVGMFLSAALLYYYNVVFIVKVALLALAVVFTYTVRSRWTKEGMIRRGGTAVAAISIGLWTLVTAAGRGVGFW